MVSFLLILHLVSLISSCPIANTHIFEVFELGWQDALEAGHSPGLPTHGLAKLANFCDCKEVRSQFCATVLKALYNDSDGYHQSIDIHRGSGFWTKKALQHQEEFVVLQETTYLDLFLRDMVRELKVNNVIILVDPLNYDGRMKTSIASFTKSSSVENIKVIVIFHWDDNNFDKKMLEVSQQPGVAFVIGEGAEKIVNSVSQNKLENKLFFFCV